MSAPNLFEHADGATPIDAEDAKALIPTWIATRADLDSAEKANIAKAVAWASSARRPKTPAALLSVEAILSLHRRMFGEVWKWAGAFRLRETNIGAPPAQIATRLHDLLADVAVQTAVPDQLPWPADELALRFHHRLVSIHPFPNGNGRHARLAADLLVGALGEPAFTWGGGELTGDGGARRAYLDALRVADATQGFAPLVAFARSGGRWEQ